MRKVYKSKYPKHGSSYREVVRQARKEYHTIQKLTPRRSPYVRSRYFRKDKVFVNDFWSHLNKKNSADRLRRLKFYRCAIDLLRNSTATPDAVTEKSKKDVVLYRFYGISKDGAGFCVQVKHDSRNNRKDFISVFPSTLQ